VGVRAAIVAAASAPACIADDAMRQVRLLTAFMDPAPPDTAAPLLLSSADECYEEYRIGRGLDNVQVAQRRNA
jgi:hypothetical protein